MAAPNYPKNSSIYNLQSIYGINWSKNNKTLRQLGYTETDISFPAFNYFWKQKGWPVDEMLDLFLMDACWNDSLWASDTYYNSGYYIRPNFISQSRAWIQAPDGKYSLAFGCFTALGRYSGVHAQISSDAQGTMPGGTGIEISHANWSSHVPDRICMPATAWGTDFGTEPLAYTEGVIIESFRFMGAKAKKTGNYISTGPALNDPGENSVIRFCMAEDFNGAGYMVYSGTPFVIDTCSAFYNDGPGFDLASSNGLNNIRIETPSGDCNKGGLIRLRPRDSQSVGGGTITFRNVKSESRSDQSGGIPQVPIILEGNMGDANIVIDGMTANAKGVPMPFLIGGPNWTGTQYEVSARGIDLRSNTDCLFMQGSKKLTGGKAYSGNSFTINDEGLAFKSRQNMQLSGSGYTGTWQTGAWGPCVAGSQTRTVTCVGGTCDPATKPAETQSCTVPPVGNQIPITIKPTVSGTNGGGRELPEYAIDNDPNTVWSNGQRQDVADAFIQFDAGQEVTWASAVFTLPGTWAGDYARTPQIYVGNNANAGSVVASTVTGTSTMTVTFPTPVKGRYFRLTAKKTAGASKWLSVGDAKFYKP